MEKIYTIPVNETFDACAEDSACGCPFCRLANRLEENELELILGASMMEPDVRIRTNALGFCREHYDMMLSRQKKLPLALILQSHLDEVRNDTESGGLSSLIKGAGSGVAEKLEKREKSCYVCERTESSLAKMFENAAWLWENDPAFRKKTDAQPYFCLPHLRMWLAAGQREIGKKNFPAFYKAVAAVSNAYFDSLREDIGWFVKKFDYRYDAEPWGNAKDACERAIRFLAGDLHRNPGK